ncbi:MAG TPA: DEAD/DEAH box helicase [Acidimicrobiales bacterium]|nr:DEAD/DEAH box helicase [Acidimicrobiales bacterium]
MSAFADLAQVESYLGPSVYARGRAYADNGQVMRIRRESERQLERLRGSVVGNGGLYDTTAVTLIVRDGRRMFTGGTCSCPMVEDCKHVAALVIAAARDDAPADDGRPRRTATWEEPLVALVGSRPETGTLVPLAIELELQPAHDTTGGWRLMGRLLRPAGGNRTGWVNGSLAWNQLDDWMVQRERLRVDHAAVASELFTLHSARARSASYGYSRYSSYGAEKTIDLTHCGPELWSVLDDAAAVGLVLLHAKGRHGEIPRPLDGRVVLDVTAAAGGGLRVTPRLEVATGHDLRPAAFLGRNGHGLVCAEQVEDNQHPRLWLVRLAAPAGIELQRMLLRHQVVDVPAGEIGRFRDELCIGLQRVATVISSDGSFTPPAVSAPALQLHVIFGDDHSVEIGWKFAYAIGDTTRQVWLGDAAEFRDAAAERALLDAVEAGGLGLESLGVIDDYGRPRDAGAVLSGLNSMRFVTNVLPRLDHLGGATLVVEGEPADYRDVGDTLEIGVATTAESGERDWFNLGVRILVEGHELPILDVFLALAKGQSEMLLDDGAHFSLREPRLVALKELIDEARLLDDAPGSALRISRYQVGLWEELVALGVVTEQAAAWQQQVERLRSLDALEQHPVPASLRAELRPYQRDGFAWLASLWELGLGGVLADDMGLGKTLQTLALFCHARERDPSLGPFLVVAPTSVVPGWVSEAAHFAPHLIVESVTDTLKKSGRVMEEIAKADVVVTTYTLLRLDAAAYAAVAWAGVVLDEAQYVKNHAAQTYRRVRELGAPWVLALTGTPMENNLMELWSLLSIAAPGLFPDPKGFGEHYAKPIEKMGDRDRLERLRRRIKPLVLRRTKELVARDLPPKQEQILEVELHARHRKIYDTQLARERQRVLGLLGDFDKNRFTILKSITVLRQLSLHPGLVDEANLSVPCAKLDALAEQLDDVVGGGHRALVFSQFTSFLSLVRARLDADGIKYAYLDGRTRNRAKVVDGFRSGDDPLFLISLKAGGFGLNLTEADYCFLLDPWWNPATENQAIDRTHRIGQTRPVNVYRLIAGNTIEEKVVALAQRKAELFAGVMDDGDLFASSLTADDIRGLFD